MVRMADGQMRPMDSQKECWMDGLVGFRQMDGWTGKWMVGWMDGWINRWMIARQIDELMK